jgi:Tfp pilus assembly protein PilO
MSSLIFIILGLVFVAGLAFFIFFDSEEEDPEKCKQEDFYRYEDHDDWR